MAAQTQLSLQLEQVAHADYEQGHSHFEHEQDLALLVGHLAQPKAQPDWGQEEHFD